MGGVEGKAGGRVRWRREALVLVIVGVALYATATIGNDGVDSRLRGHEDYEVQPAAPKAGGAAARPDDADAAAGTRAPRRSPDAAGSEAARTGNAGKPQPRAAGSGRQRRSAASKQPQQRRVPPTPASELPPDPSKDPFPAAPPVPTVQTPERLIDNYAQIEDLARLPHTAEEGCEEVLAAQGQSPAQWGPPAPIVRVSRTGTLIQSNFEFARLPESRACRPVFVDLVVFAHDARNEHWSSSRRVRVESMQGSVEVRLHANATEPPYFARVRALAADLRPSREIRIQLP